jgi:hypothetical protein
VTVTAGPSGGDAAASDTATQPRRHASTPVTRTPLPRPTRALGLAFSIIVR